MQQWHYTIDRGENIRNALVFSPEGTVRTYPPHQLTELLKKCPVASEHAEDFLLKHVCDCIDGSGLMGLSSHPANERLTSLE